MRNKLLLFTILVLLRLVNGEAQQLFLNLPADGSVACGEEVIIPVTVANYANINTLQFQVQWDTLAFEFVSQQNDLGILLLDGRSSEGILSAGVLGTPNNLADEAVLFTFTLRVIAETSTPSLVFISDVVSLGGTLTTGGVLDIVRDTTTFSFSSNCGTPTPSPTISCPTQTVFSIGEGQDSSIINGLAPTLNNDDGSVNVIYNLLTFNNIIKNGENDASGETFSAGTTQLNYVLVDKVSGNIVSECTVDITLVAAVGVADSSILIGSNAIDCSSGSIVCVDVNIGEIDNISDIQFALQWDTSLLEFESATVSTALQNTTLSDVGRSEVQNGILRFSMVEVTGLGVDFNSNDNLLTVCFRPKLNGSAAVTFTGETLNGGIKVNQYVGGSGDLNDLTDVMNLIPGAITVSNCSDIIITPPTTSNGVAIGSAVSDCSSGTQTCVDVLISEFQDLANIQFSVNWDPSILRFASVENNDAILNINSTNYGQVKTVEGILNFSWFDIDFNGQDFAANERLFTLCFTPLANGSADLRFSDNETPIKINQYNAALEQTEITEGLSFSDGTIQISNCDTTNPPTSTTAGVAISQLTVDCNTTGSTCVDVLISEFEDLANIQFSVNWDPTILRFVSVDSNQVLLNPASTQFGLLRTNEGMLNFSWFDLDFNGQDFATNDRLFTLCFAPVKNGNGELRFSNTETPIKVNQYNASLEQMEITDGLAFSNGAIAVSNCSEVELTNGIAISGAQIDCTLANASTCVDVNIAEFNDLANIQFSVSWDSTILEYVSVSNNDVILNPASTDYGLLRTSEGMLNFSWFDIDFNGQDFAANDRLFTLCFNAIGKGDAALAFSNNETPIKVNQYNAALEQMEITDGLSFNAGVVSTVDTIGPVASNCPTADIVVYTTPDNCTVVGNWTEPTFSDACGATTLQQTNQLGEAFGVGERVIQYTAIDDSGNITDCSFVLSVRDTIAPSVTNCPNDIVRDLSVATDCDPRVTWTAPTVTDACSMTPIITSSFQSADTFQMGESLVTYTVMDGAGNINNSCSFTVTLTGQGPLRISGCPDDIVTSFTTDTGCELAVDWSQPILIDGCSSGETTFSSTHQSGDQFPLGTTLVTYTAADEGGNTAEPCTFNITITGTNEIAFPNCPGNITINSLQGQCGATTGWTVPDVTGGCGTVSIVSNFEPLDFFPVGTSVVEYTGTDDVQQQSVCSFSVTVVDDQSLVAICPTDIVINSNGAIIEDEGNFIDIIALEDCGSYRVQYKDIEAFDNCSSTISRSLTQGLASNSLFGFGSTAMSVDVSNASGESVTCSFNIQINEAPPVVASLSAELVCEGQQVELRASDIPGAEFSWRGPSGFVSSDQNAIINSPTVNNSGMYIVSAMTPTGCAATDTVMVQVNSAPTVTGSANDLECGGGTIELIASAEGVPVTAWAWTGPNGYTSDEQNPMINEAGIAQAGFYIVTGISANRCAIVDSVEVEINTIAPPTVAASGLLPSGVACEGESFTLKGNVYTGTVIYNWEGSNSGAGLPADVNDSLIMVTPTNVGEYTYRYTVDLGNGCVADTAITIMVMASPQFTAASNGPFICADTSDQIMLTTETDDATIMSWTWTGPNDYISPFPTSTIREVKESLAGDYVVTAASVNGCTATDTVALEITGRPSVPTILADDRMMICEGESSTIFADTSAGATYQWTGPNDFEATGPSFEISPALPESTGGYQLVQTVEGCDSDPATVIVSVLTDPEVTDDQVSNLYNESVEFEVISNDTLTAGAGFTINLLNEFTSEAGSLTNNGDGSFSFTPVQDWIGKVQVAYELCYEDCPELCSMGIVTIDTDVPSEPCFIPSVLSPNGDDKNDALIISCNSDPPKGGGIMIFNQWGAKVYQAFPYTNDWKGTYEGEDLPDGTYYYIYSQTDGDPDPKKGCVTIFR